MQDEFAVEQEDSPYPFVLTTGRLRDQWHTMTKTGVVNKLKQHIEKPFLEIHPDDAKNLQLIDGQNTIIENAQGEICVRISITNSIKMGVVFLPMHWGKILNSKGRANNLTSGKVDPISKEPDFKFSRVSVRAAEILVKKICVVGAGAAALQFIKSYREKNNFSFNSSVY